MTTAEKLVKIAGLLKQIEDVVFEAFDSVDFLSAEMSKYFSIAGTATDSQHCGIHWSVPLDQFINMAHTLGTSVIMNDTYVYFWVDETMVYTLREKDAE